MQYVHNLLGAYVFMYDMLMTARVNSAQLHNAHRQRGFCLHHLCFVTGVIIPIIIPKM